MSNTTIAYDDLDMSLHRAQVETEPAELHGVMCATICVPPGSDASSWMDEEIFSNLGESAALTQSREMVQQLWQITHEQITGPDCDLALLLPDEDTSLADRSEAFAAWCEGFLYGMGLHGQARLKGLSADSRELMTDMSEFTRLDIEEEDSEDGEAALQELVEYVRVGVLMVYQDLAENESAAILPNTVTRH